MSTSIKQGIKVTFDSKFSLKLSILFSDFLFYLIKKKSNVNRKGPYDPATLLLGIYAKEIKTGYQRDICTPILTAALFTIAKIWKCPSGDVQINRCGKNRAIM